MVAGKPSKCALSSAGRINFVLPEAGNRDDPFVSPVTEVHHFTGVALASFDSGPVPAVLTAATL